MKNEAPPADHASYREAIAAFLQERLHAKLDKLKDEEDDKRQEVLAQHQPHRLARRCGTARTANPGRHPRPQTHPPRRQRHESIC